MRRTYRYQKQEILEKPKKENKSIVKEDQKRSRISPPRRKIYAFSDLRILENCGSIDLTKKGIETFTGLPNLKFLVRLNLDSNPLRSFEGSPELPNLRWFSARNSPISRNPYFKLMTIIVFGENVTTINNEKVMPQIHKQARAFRRSLKPELLKGRIIANLRPLRFIDTKNDIVVNAEPSILAATKKIGYKAPSVQEFERTIVERSREQVRLPSIASICDEIIERDDEESKNYFPDNFMDDFLSKLHDLRIKYNAKFVLSSSDYENSEEEEETNDDTQFQDIINDASPIKPPQAAKVAQHLLQSESESDLKTNQSMEEELNEVNSHHSSKQEEINDLNSLVEEEEKIDLNAKIGSEDDEEEKNENENAENDISQNDDVLLNEEEEDENQKIQTLEAKNEEEENEKENDTKEADNNSESTELQKESNDTKEEENKNEKSDKEGTEEHKDESSDLNLKVEEEEKLEIKEEEEEEIQIKKEEEEEEEKTEIESNINVSDEEEKKDYSQSIDNLEQNQEDVDPNDLENQADNLSENNSTKSEDD